MKIAMVLFAIALIVLALGFARRQRTPQRDTSGGSGGESTFQASDTSHCATGADGGDSCGGGDGGGGGGGGD